VEFTCWSATRPAFPLTVREEQASGNVDCTWRPLTEAECRDFGPKHQTRVRAGYRVRVTVHERREGVPLDLGPFRRKLVVTGPVDGETASVTVAGVVRGEVALAAPENADRIDLRSFPAAAGTEKKVTLVAEEANVDMRLDSRTPNYLDVRLEPHEATDGRRRWDLFVQVPPRAVLGPLPEDAAVILRIEGAVTHRMRLPLSGQGTQ
jgi:hypothetical protein